MLLRVCVRLYLKGKEEAYRCPLRHSMMRACVCGVGSVSFVSGSWYSLLSRWVQEAVAMVLSLEY